VVLIVMFVLLTIAFVRYERRVHQHPRQSISTAEAKSSPSPVQSEDEHESSVFHNSRSAGVDGDGNCSG
jgi:uncharacterized ion transporter superfamily protein YfcC